MKFGLNGSTTNQCNIIEDIEVASQSGYDLLELRTYKINDFLKGGGKLEILKEKFETEKIIPYAINALEFFTLKPSDAVESVLQEFEYWCNIAKQINCENIVVVPSRYSSNKENKEYIISDAVSMLERLSDIASNHNVKVAFEFIGFSDFSVSTLKLANEIVKKVSRENVGLVIDTYHFFNGGCKVEDILEVDKDKIFVFHINDVEKGIPKDKLTDEHRVFPTIGEFPLKDLGNVLKSIGYSEMMSLELFRKEYWEMDKTELGDKSIHYMRKAYELMWK